MVAYFMFKNREEAGKRLAGELKHLKSNNLLVLAIPRGGVVVGKIIAQELGCPLKAIIVKKIGTPGNPELAVGAMRPDEKVVWNDDILSQLGLKETDLIEQIKNEKFKMKNYKEKFKKEEMDLKNKNVILTDDGIATGATVEAAIAWTKTKMPAKIILAVPVAPPVIRERLKGKVDEAIFLETPIFFEAVGQFYQEFPPVSDEEVIKLLKEED